MEENPGYKLLKEIFDKFAAKYSAEDMTARALRSAAAGSKAAVDRAMQEFPKSFINQMAKDIYGVLTSQELADAVSMEVRSFDEAKVKGLIDGAIDVMKDPVTARKIARQIKQALDKAPPGVDIAAQIQGMAGFLPGGELVGPILGILITPIIEDIKNGSEEDAAEKIMELADQIPGDVMVEAVTGFTQQVTPERVSRSMHDVVGKMPSPGAVAGIVHGIGGAASKHMERMTDIHAAAEIPSILQDFARDAKAAVSDTIANDNASKKKFRKKGPGKKQGFDL